MTIDWTQAPAWARWHAFDNNREGYWYDEKPKPWLKLGIWSQSNGAPDTSGYTLPAGQDWRQSLVERPKEETK